MWYFFAKAGHSDLLFLGVTCNGKMQALTEFQKSGAYEKQEMGLTLKTENVILF